MSNKHYLTAEIAGILSWFFLLVVFFCAQILPNISWLSVDHTTCAFLMILSAVASVLFRFFRMLIADALTEG